MRWTEITEAAENGVLFHWMDLDKAEHVVETNTMDARWKHLIDNRAVLGNSFSRNKVFRFGEERCIRLTVDRRVIAQTNKIIPLDGELVHSREHYPRALTVDRHFHSKTGAQFAEEFVVGPIKNLSRAIIKVEIDAYNSGRFYATAMEVKEYCARNDIECILTAQAQKFIKDTEDRWAEDD